MHQPVELTAQNGIDVRVGYILIFNLTNPLLITLIQFNCIIQYSQLIEKLSKLILSNHTATY